MWISIHSEGSEIKGASLIWIRGRPTAIHWPPLTCSRALEASSWAFFCGACVSLSTGRDERRAMSPNKPNSAHLRSEDVVVDFIHDRLDLVLHYVSRQIKARHGRPLAPTTT
jgi:hypothetical protein